MYSSSLFQSPGTFQDTQNTLDMITSHFTELLRLKSKELYEHSVRVSNYAGATAVYMRLPANEITLIRYAGLLHDIGLLSIPNQILSKVPYLSRRELSLYKKHPELGANMLESVPGCQDLLPYIRCHHERWDGTGYPGHVDPARNGEPIQGYADEHGKPRGKRGEEIPLFGRVVAVADVYDALSSKRAYKDAWSEEDVFNELRKGAGKHFDPEVIEAFFSVIDVIRSLGRRYSE